MQKHTQFYGGYLQAGHKNPALLAIALHSRARGYLKGTLSKGIMQKRVQCYGGYLHTGLENPALLALRCILAPGGYASQVADMQANANKVNKRSLAMSAGLSYYK